MHPNPMASRLLVETKRIWQLIVIRYINRQSYSAVKERRKPSQIRASERGYKVPNPHFKPIYA